MKTILVFLSIISLMACKSTQGSNNDPIIYLENENIKAAFLPEVGGRLVFLGRPGGENLLKSDSTLWREAGEERLAPSAEAEWKAYEGHIIWIGPQSEWWTRQDLNPKRRDSKAIWPPDPYLIYGNFEVLEQTATSLLLEGPASPISGVQLTKRYSLTESGLEIEVKMANSSDVPVSWDIWSNTRFDESTLFFVPECEDGVLRISMDESSKTEGLKGEIVESAFTFVREELKSGEKQRYAKAFLHPEHGRIVALGKGAMLVMEFDYVEQDHIHTEQGFVEVYKMQTPGGKEDLLELEHHSAYVNLQAGDSHMLKEVWSVHDYSGEMEAEEAVNYYNRLNH